MAMPAFALKMSQDPPQAAPSVASWQRVAATSPAVHPPTPGTAVAAGPLARPGRVVAGWMVAVALVVAGSTAYLSLLVHMAMMGRYAAQLERQLEVERRRGEALEVALARETSPARTEAMARVLLAMEKPRQVRLVVLDNPTGGQSLARAGAEAGRGSAPGAGVRAASAGGEQRADAGVARASREGGWLARLGAAVAGLVGSKPVALARQLPSWP